MNASLRADPSAFPRGGGVKAATASPEDSGAADMTPSERLRDARLYVCADLSRGLEWLLTFAEAAFVGGVDILQVRDKGAEARTELEVLRALRPIADAYGALLAANDRADVAVLAGVDILHLGQGDLTTEDARALVGPNLLIGRSTRSEEEMRQAADDADLDYFCTGPVWETPTKPGRAAVGLDLPRAATAYVATKAEAKPFFAIGGIDLKRVPDVLASGAKRIVVVRAVTEAAAPQTAAASLRAAVVDGV